jgi:hypothetical protein
MPVKIGGKDQPEYRPFANRAKRALGFGRTAKDVDLPASGGESPADLGRKIGKGAKQARELMSKYRSPSKR